MQKRNLELVYILFWFLFLGAVFFVKSTLVTYRYHLDPWVIKPLGELLESNLDWEQNVMFPGLWLRLFYIATVVFSLITGIGYSALTKYWFIVLSSILIFCLWTLIRSRYRQTRNKAVLVFLFLLLLLQNDFFLRRLSMMVRENYTLIALISYFLIYTKAWFKAPVMSGILSWVIYGSNPITSFILLGFNGIYWLYWMVKRNSSRFWERAKQFIWWIVCWLYFFIEFIKSLFWQYQYVETEVVLKNPFSYDFYYITLKHINSFLLIMLLLACATFWWRWRRKQWTMIYRGEGIILFILLFIYLIAFSPKIWLYQDRLVVYICIFSFLFIIPYLKEIKNKIILLLLGVFSVIRLWIGSSYEYYSPFDNTQLDLPEYTLFENYTWNMLLFKFDEYMLRQKNPYLKINYTLVEQFESIASESELTQFLADHEFILFLTKASMRQEESNYDLPAIKFLTEQNKITKLEDGNFLYIHKIWE